MNVTIYKKPHGRTEVIDCIHVYPEDEKFFIENNIRISMEDIGGQFAIYADIGKMTPDDEPDELIQLSGSMDCFDTLKALRVQCEEAIAA